MKVKKRPGMTLLELLGVMAVLAIISTIGISNLMSAQTKARVTTAQESIESYNHAFTTACILHPGIVSDRDNNWTDEATYSSQQGLQRVVKYINESTDDRLDFQWDNTLKCYVSYGNDPWGGSYILTEYPILADGTSYFDPTAAGNESHMGIAIWVTGNSDQLLSTKTVGTETYGIALMFTDGLVDSISQGFNGQYPLNDATIKMQ